MVSSRVGDAFVVCVKFTYRYDNTGFWNFEQESLLWTENQRPQQDWPAIFVPYQHPNTTVNYLIMLLIKAEIIITAYSVNPN